MTLLLTLYLNSNIEIHKYKWNGQFKDSKEAFKF